MDPVDSTVRWILYGKGAQRARCQLCWAGGGGKMSNCQVVWCAWLRYAGGSSHKPLDSPHSLGQFSTEAKCNMFLIFLDHFTRLILEKAVCVVVCRSTFKSSWTLDVTKTIHAKETNMIRLQGDHINPEGRWTCRRELRKDQQRKPLGDSDVFGETHMNQAPYKVGLY